MMAMIRPAATEQQEKKSQARSDSRRNWLSFTNVQSAVKKDQ
jgi:hypothetical protein